MGEPSRSTAEVITEALSLRLGPSTAHTAIRTFASRAGIHPGDLSPANAPRFLEALRPTLRTLLGVAPADDVLEGIRGDLR